MLERFHHQASPGLLQRFQLKVWFRKKRGCLPLLSDHCNRCIIQQPYTFPKCPGWRVDKKLAQMRDIWRINNPLNNLLDGLFSGKGYLVKGSKQSWVAAEIDLWVIQMIPFKHSYKKYRNFRHNPPLPLQSIFSLKKQKNPIAFRLISVLIFPNPQFLPCSFTT